MKRKHDDDNVTREIEEEEEANIGDGGGGGGEVKEEGDEEIHDGGGDNAGEKEDEELINAHATQEKEELINDDTERNGLSDKEQEEVEDDIITLIHVKENQQDAPTNQNPNGCVGEQDKSNAKSEVQATKVKAEGAANNEDGVDRMEEDSPVKKEERETKPDVSYLKANEEDDEIEELEEEKGEQSEGSESESDKEELQKQHHSDLVAIEEQPLFLNEEEGGSESGNEYEQTAFMKELESFCREHHLDFKPPKFYGEGLNLLKLWRAVIKLGGYDQVTTCKLWRQVGESFNPPKTCTTVSWTFRIFYEKALLEYEKHKIHAGELHFLDSSPPDPKSAGNTRVGGQVLGSGRARRDAASRAMQGWHSQRLDGNDEDKNAMSTQKRESQLRAGLLKRRRPADMDHFVKSARANFKATKQRGSSPQRMDTTPTVIDIGHPADWVKVNVRRTRDCFEVYALVPGLLREEVRVQSDPSGRVVISGQPEEPDNPWGVTVFKKVITLPSRIDPHQTSAIVTLHGQLFVRVPFEQSDS